MNSKAWFAANLIFLVSMIDRTGPALAAEGLSAQPGKELLDAVLILYDVHQRGPSSTGWIYDEKPVLRSNERLVVREGDLVNGNVNGRYGISGGVGLPTTTSVSVTEKDCTAQVEKKVTDDETELRNSNSLLVDALRKNSPGLRYSTEDVDMLRHTKVVQTYYLNNIIPSEIRWQRVVDGYFVTAPGIQDIYCERAEGYYLGLFNARTNATSTRFFKEESCKREIQFVVYPAKAERFKAVLDFIYSVCAGATRKGRF